MNSNVKQMNAQLKNSGFKSVTKDIPKNMKIIESADELKKKNNTILCISIKGY